MYLLAIWPLNICESNGKSIFQGAWLGNQHGESPFDGPRQSNWQWGVAHLAMGSSMMLAYP